MSAAIESALAAVENVETAAAVAIESAEQRAAAAETVAAQITEAAIRTELSDRIDDLSEDLLSCREENQSLRTELSSLKTWAETQISEIQAKQAAPPQVIVAPASPSPATPLIPQTSETAATVVTTVEPSSESAAALPAPVTQPKRSRLI